MDAGGGARQTLCPGYWTNTIRLGWSKARSCRDRSMSSDEHYLKKELDALVGTDSPSV